jgi:hypothetical protein
MPPESATHADTAPHGAAADGFLRSRRGRALTAVLFAAAAAALFLYWLPAARTYYSHTQPLQTGSRAPQFDLFQYYASGHNWRLGLDPYKPLRGVPGALSVPRSSRISGFIYPPVVLPLFGALSRLPYDDARAVWLAVTLSLLVCPLLVGAALAPGRRWLTLGAGLLLLFVSNPALFHIRQGQVDMIVAGLAVTGYLLYGRWRSWPTAMLLAAAVSIKLTPLVLVLALVAYRRDWRLLVKVAVVVAGLGLASLTVVHPRLYVEYLTLVLPAASEGNPFFHNQSLLRSWSHLGEWAKLASLSGFALVIALAAVAGQRPRRRSAPQRQAGDGDAASPSRRATDAGGEAPGHGPLRSRDLQVLCLAAVGLLLFAPLSWRMAFVWAVVPLALVLAAAPWDGRRRYYAALLAGAVLMSLPVWDAMVLDSLETIGALVAGAALTGAILEWSGRERAPTPAPS